MTCLTSDDLIEKAGLSTRCYNGLRRAGIKTIADLTEYDCEKLLEIRKLGAKSVSEVGQFLDLLKSGTGNFRLVSPDDMLAIVSEEVYDASAHMSFRNADGILCQDIPIENIGLSVRAFNCLKRARYNSASQLIDVTKEKLSSIRNLGRHSISEILQKVNAITFTEASTIHVACEENLQCKTFVFAISELISTHGGNLYQALLPIFERAGFEGRMVDSEELFEIPYLRDAAKDKIAILLSGFTFGADIDEVIALAQNGHNKANIKP
jgi:hypothetical protein